MKTNTASKTAGLTVKTAVKAGMNKADLTEQLAFRAAGTSGTNPLHP